MPHDVLDRRQRRAGGLPRAAGVFTLAVLGLLTALVGCTHPTLGKPVFIGASATAGVGATTAAAPEGELPVDLAVAYAAVVSAPHSVPRRLGDGTFFLQPLSAALEQASAASAEPSTIIFAVDWLFWPVYSSISEADRVGPQGEATTALAGGPRAARAARSDAEIRVERLAVALAHLERFDQERVPIVLGDVPYLPNGGAAPPAVELPSTRPSAAEIKDLDARLRAWAEVRPWVVILPVAELFAGSRTLPDGTPLLQPDELHPTAAGLVHLVQMAMEALEVRGLVEPSDWRRDVTGASSRLAIASRTALQSPMSGWLDKAAIYAAYEDLSTILSSEPVDCAKVVPATDRLFSLAVRLDRDPTGYGLGAAMASGIAGSAMERCPATATAIRRSIERLGFETRGSRPNAFKLELWAGLMVETGRLDEAAARLTALAANSDRPTAAYAESYRAVAARLRAAPGEDASPERRAKVIELYGGVDATVANGRSMIQACLDPSVDPRESPSLRAMIDGGRDPRALPLVARTLDAADAGRLASFAARVQPIYALVRDLRCAQMLGVPSAGAGADALLAELNATFGVGGRGLANARGGSGAADALLPGWAIAAWGSVDFAAERAWSFGSGAGTGDLLRSATTVMRLVGGSRTMAVLLRTESPHSIGQLGTFEAADGLLTMVDGVATVSEVDDDALGSEATATEAATPRREPTLRSRRAAPDDPRKQSIRAIVANWQRVALPECADLDALHAAAWAAASDAGVDVAWPFPLRIDGDFTAIDVRVDRSNAAPRTDQEAAELQAAALRSSSAAGSTPPALMIELAPMRFTVPPGHATLIGFAAPWSVGSLVRPGQPMRLHAVWTDGSGTTHTGEVEALRGASGMTMAVPGTDGPRE